MIWIVESGVFGDFSTQLREALEKHHSLTFIEWSSGNGGPDWWDNDDWGFEDVRVLFYGSLASWADNRLNCWRRTYPTPPSSSTEVVASR